MNIYISSDTYLQLLKDLKTLGSYSHHEQGADAYARDSLEFRRLLYFFIELCDDLNN